MIPSARIRSLVVAASLAACTPMVEGSDKAAELTKQIVDHTRQSWQDVFTYRPKKPEQLPQTRYCYNTMSDIVCYDSAQAGITSHLNGYQDGTNISWVQPGGGSLGASGGEPTAQAGATGAQVAPNAMKAAAPVTVSSNVAVNTSEISSAPITPPAAAKTVVDVDTSPTPTAKAGGVKKNASDPFYSKQSPYVKAQ